ncbi:MAG: hypothetical protein JWR52_1997 [Marmoricola sp.]|nr:hypothetical protein [Marmoricola sp.]
MPVPVPPSSLPRSASLALWLDACLRGLLGPDDFATAVRHDDPQHLVVGWPGTDGAPFALDLLPGKVAALGTWQLLLALPVPGDPLGLKGPPAFNADALDAGEAVVLLAPTQSWGLVPTTDARTVLWQVQPADAAAVLDPGEASRSLRQVLLEVTAELVRLDVASWQPEIPDLLLNLRHRPGLALPPGTSADDAEALERAVLCAEIVELALLDDSGAVTAYEIQARRGSLRELDRAARRAIVAVCSASLGPT